MKKAVSPELQALLDRSQELRAEAARLIEQATDVDADAAQHAPVKVNDVIPTRGFSYRGKDMRVTRVAIIRHGAKPLFRAWGSVLRKDGAEGSTATSVYWNIDGTETEAPWL